MGRLDRFAIARALREIAALLRLSREPTFRAKAYEGGARVLERMPENLDELIAKQQLTRLAGIGAGLARTITELYETGESKALNELRQRYPPGIGELIQLPKLGLTKIRALHHDLGIDSIESLKEACEQGEVRNVRGFTADSEKQLLAAIAEREKRGERMLLVHAEVVASDILAFLRQHPLVQRAEAAGSLRRCRETVGNIDLVVAHRIEGDDDQSRETVLDHIERCPASVGTVERTSSCCSIELADGMRVDVRVATATRYVSAWHHFTGAAAHISKLHQLGAARGLHFDRELWVWRKADAELRLRSEAELYKRLQLPEIIPELREDNGEIEAAVAGELPTDLVTLEDLRGAVHCHTVYSDGKNTIAEMAAAADEMGLEYITITDHSPKAAYAGGLTIDRLRRQWDEIAEVQETSKVRLLRGTESDILADGGLDYPDTILEQLEVVIASVHERHQLDSARMTERLVRAMRHPCFKIWGHGLGRLLQRRPPFECDVEAVLDAAAESRAAIEINGDPHRLDLEPRWLRASRERGLKFVVSCDAHSTANLRYLRFGVAMARRGWVRRSEVLNTLSATKFSKAVSPT